MKNNTLIRYFVKELTLYFIIAFLFFFLVFFVNQILLMAEDVLKKRVPLVQVVQLIVYSLPFVIAQSAPFGTLVGFLMCIGRMMSDNEILIVRASGLSFRILLIPVLILGLVISCCSFFVNDYLLPLGTISYNKLYKEIILSNPGVELESNSIKRTDDSTLVIGTVNGREVSDLLFFDTDDDGNQRIIVSGKTLIADAKDRSIIMQLQMENSYVTIIDKKEKNTYDYLVTENTVMNVFSSTLFPKSKSGTNPREMTSFDLKMKIADMKTKPDKHSKFQVNIYELEYYKKFSLPFASLFFSMLAMPLAVIFGKVNGQTIGLIVGILLSVVYWAFLILGQTFGIRNGVNGFWSMWLPDMLVGAVGIVFYTRLVRR